MFKNFMLMFFTVFMFNSCSFLSKKTATSDHKERKPSSLYAFSSNRVNISNPAVVRSQLKKYPFGQAVLKTNGRPVCVVDVSKNPHFLPSFATPAGRVRRKVNLPNCNARQASLIRQNAKTASLVYDKGQQVAVLQLVGTAVGAGVICVLSGAGAAELAASDLGDEAEMYNFMGGSAAGAAGFAFAKAAGGLAGLVCGVAGNFLGRSGYSGKKILRHALGGIMKAANWTKGQVVEYIIEEP